MISSATEELPNVDDALDFRECYAAFHAPPAMKTLPWCQERAVTDRGRPYDHSAYPHLGAPGGPCDANDDTRVRVIAMQFGVRLGKTFFGQVTGLKEADNDPCPQMFVSSREKLALEVIQRTYEMAEKAPRLRGLLLKPPRLRKRDMMEFRGSKMFVGWARSASTLADKNIKRGHGNEIDKWDDFSTSKEGDSLDLFLDRFNDYRAVRKVILEGTPTIKGRSRIERFRYNGWNCSYFVPCPKCRRYQVLEIGTPETPHGVKWQKGPTGKSDPDVAWRTAWYQCRHCDEKIKSDQRGWMMRRGVWAPEGCTVQDKSALAIAEGRKPYEWKGWKRCEWVEGEPRRDAEIASYHLATLAALSIPDWGDFAREVVNAKGRPQAVKRLRNQWWADTWQADRAQTTWQELGGRIIRPDLQRGIAPAGCRLLTCGIDKQGDHYVYVVEAWSVDRSSHTVAYGTCKDLETLEKSALIPSYPTADGRSLRIRMHLIDSGFRTKEVYLYVRQARRRNLPILPCKGSSSPLDTFVVRRKLGKRTSAPGQIVVMVDPNSTQDWVDRALHILRPGDAESTTLFAGSSDEHQEHLAQLLNETTSSRLNKYNRVTETWRRMDEDIPNDYRDAKRYALGAMMLVTKGEKISAASSVTTSNENSPQTPRSGSAPLPRVRMFSSPHSKSRRSR